MQELPRDGMMAVVFADRERVAELIMPYAQDSRDCCSQWAAECRDFRTSRRAVCDLLDQFELAGVKTRPLEVSHAFHSPLLDPILDEFEQRAGEVTYHSPQRSR